MYRWVCVFVLLAVDEDGEEISVEKLEQKMNE